MSLEVVELITTLKADIAAFKTGMEDAKTASQSFADRFAAHSLAIGAAATGLGGLLEHFADPIERSKATLEAVLQNAGSSFDDLRGPIDDVVAHMQNFGHGTADTEAALATLTTKLGDPTAALNDMGVVAEVAAYKHTSLAAAATLVGKITDGNAKTLKQFGLDAGSTVPPLDQLSGKLGGIAENQAKTFGGEMQAAKVKVEDFAGAVGSKVAPALELAGPLLMGVGQAVPMVSSAMEAWKVATEDQTAAQWALNVAMDANPIGLVIAGIGVLATAGIVVYENWEKVSGAVSDATHVVGDAVGWVTGLFGSHKKAVSDAEAANEALSKAQQASAKAAQAQADALLKADVAAEKQTTTFMSVANDQRSYQASLRGVQSAQADLTDSQTKLNDLVRTHGVVAKDVKSAQDNLTGSTKALTTAQKDLDSAVAKLNTDMKPASIDEMRTAEDKLKSSTLDLQDAQSSLADAMKKRDDIAKALASGTSLDPASTDELAIAQGDVNDALDKYNKTAADATSTTADIARAHKDYTDRLQAQVTLQGRGKQTAADLAAANEDVQRKTIGVDTATTGLNTSQANLNTTMQQGSNLDPQVIADRQAIADKTSAMNDATAKVAQSQGALNLALAGDPTLKADVAGLRKDVADKSQALADAQWNAAGSAMQFKTDTDALTSALQKDPGSRAAYLDWLRQVNAWAPGAAFGMSQVMASVGTLASPPGIPGLLGGPKLVGGKIPGRAAGGSVTAGLPYWVGENGPEPFIPNQSGTIIPNGASAGGGGGGGGGGTTVIHVHVAGSVVTDQQLVDKIHEGFLAKQRLRGNLGLVSA